MQVNAADKIILAKIEVTYGTDPTPDGTSNAILTKGFKLKPIEGGSVQRDLDRPGLGNEQAIMVGSHVACEFDVEIAGSGTAGTAPPWGPLMRACGNAETINAGIDVQYDPVSSGFESVTLYYYNDGNLYSMTGVRGSWSISVSSLQIPMLHFTLTGMWVDPAAGADPTPDFSAFQEPVAVSNAATSFTIHGNTSILHELKLDAKLTVTHRDLPNQENVIIAGRDVGGDCTIDDPGLAAYNWPLMIKQNTQDALQLIHGTIAGNIVQVDAPLCQGVSLEPGESDGIGTWQIGLICSPSDSGDDDYKFTVS